MFVCTVVIYRTSTTTTGIYVLSIVVYHFTLPLYPAALCCPPSPPRSFTSRRPPPPRRPVSTTRPPPPPRRRPHRRRRRRRHRVGPGRPSAGWRIHGLPPYIIAGITRSAARCAPPAGPDLVSTADRQFALSLLPLTIPPRDAIVSREAPNTLKSRTVTGNTVIPVSVGYKEHL